VICLDRLQRAENLQRFEARLSQGDSERQAAAELGVARTTLREWRAERSAQEVEEELAAQLVITLRAGAGVRTVCEFLQLSGLSAFVAASYGSQQKRNYVAVAHGFRINTL
jgi:hypothetical protein